MMLEKKALGEYKRKCELHVLLIMEQEKVTKSAAITQAYHEGVEGVSRRLSYTPGPTPLEQAIASSKTK